MLQQFADRAAPGFRNAALGAALRDRADELVRQDVEVRATRRRLVTVPWSNANTLLLPGGRM